MFEGFVEFAGAEGGGSSVRGEAWRGRVVGVRVAGNGGVPTGGRHAGDGRH